MRRQDGAVLAEFAVVAIALFVLLGGFLELGRALAAQHVIENAARAAARELSLRAVPAESDLGSALDSVFDPGFLVIDEDLLAACGVPGFDEPGHDEAFREQIAPRLPLLNRMLQPLMIPDRVDGQEMLRYPGALLLRNAAPSGCEDGSRYTVAIPLVEGGDVTWRRVVEPLPFDDGTGTGVSLGFPLSAGGVVSLEILYPFQAAALLSWIPASPGSNLFVPEEVVPLASDAPPRDGAPARAGFEPGEPGRIQAYGGPFGLGRVYGPPRADGSDRAVRPYRRVLSGRAIYRREVFL